MHTVWDQNLPTICTVLMCFLCIKVPSITYQIKSYTSNCFFHSPQFLLLTISSYDAKYIYYASCITQVIIHYSLQKLQKILV